MTCPHCITGFVITLYDETKCLACGWALNEPYPKRVREPYWRIRCANCQRPPVTGKNYCRICLEKMVQWKIQRKAKAAG